MTNNRISCLSLSLFLASVSAGTALAQTIASSAPVGIPTNAPSSWKTSAALGLTLTRGNSDTTTLSGNVISEKKWQVNDLTLGADGLYGTTKIAGGSGSTENADTLHAFGQYNRSFTERFYGYARLDGLHDGIADIQYRLTIAPGVGYYFIRQKTTDLSLEAGPGWIDEKLGNEYLNYAILRVAEKFHYALSDRARVWETLEWLPQVDNFNNYIINLELGIEADLNKKKNLALRVTFDDTYNNVPAFGREKNDLKLITAIAYKF